MQEEYTLVAVTRKWVPDWLWKFFCVRFPLIGGLGVIQPFRWILTTPVKPQHSSHHPHCVWCEGSELEHHLVVTMTDDRPEPYLRCQHCDYSREMTDIEADADWDEMTFK